MNGDARAEAREQIARGLHRFEAGAWDNCPTCWQRADAVLAVPAVADALAAIERVRALHQPIDPEGYPAEGEVGYCDHDGFIWPCKTSRALDGPT